MVHGRVRLTGPRDSAPSGPLDKATFFMPKEPATLDQDNDAAGATTDTRTGGSTTTGSWVSSPHRSMAPMPRNRQVIGAGIFSRWTARGITSRPKISDR